MPESVRNCVLAPGRFGTRRRGKTSSQKQDREGNRRLPRTRPQAITYEKYNAVISFKIKRSQFDLLLTFCWRSWPFRIAALYKLSAFCGVM